MTRTYLTGFAILLALAFTSTVLAGGRVNSVGLRSEPAQAITSPRRSEKPDAGSYSAEQFTVREVRGVKVAAKDGVRLSVDVYRPETDERFPGRTWAGRSGGRP